MRDGLALVAIVAIGLGLRLAHVHAVADYQVVNAVPGLDRWLTMEIAKDVAGGDLTGGELGHYESSPSYAVLLGLAYRVCGGSWRGPLVMQAMFGALAPLFLYVAGRSLGLRGAGLAAAALASLYAPSVFHEGLTLKFALVPATVAMLLAASASAGRSTSAIIATGALQAFLASLRPNSLITLPVLLAWLLRRSGRPAGHVLAAFAVGALVVAVPVGGRRMAAARAGHSSSLWGIHFYIGTVLHGDGGYQVVPDVADDVFGHVDDARGVAERELGHVLSPGEVSRYWFERGVDTIRGAPGDYLALQGRKVKRLLSASEDDIFGDDLERYRVLSPVLSWPLPGFGVLIPLAACGILVGLHRRSPIGWVAAFAGAYAVSLVVFFVTGRYRLALAPALMLCAGAAIDWLTKGGRQSLIAGVSIVLLTSVVPGIRWSDLAWTGGIVAVAVVTGVRHRAREPSGHST